VRHCTLTLRDICLAHFVFAILHRSSTAVQSLLHTGRWAYRRRLFVNCVLTGRSRSKTGERLMLKLYAKVAQLRHSAAVIPGKFPYCHHSALARASSCRAAACASEHLASNRLHCRVLLCLHHCMHGLVPCMQPACLRSSRPMKQLVHLKVRGKRQRHLLTPKLECNLWTSPLGDHQSWAHVAWLHPPSPWHQRWGATVYKSVPHAVDAGVS